MIWRCGRPRRCLAAPSRRSGRGYERVPADIREKSKSRRSGSRGLLERRATPCSSRASRRHAQHDWCGMLVIVSRKYVELLCFARAVLHVELRGSSLPRHSALLDVTAQIDSFVGYTILDIVLQGECRQRIAGIDGLSCFLIHDLIIPLLEEVPSNRDM